MLPGYCHAVHSKTSGKTCQEDAQNPGGAFKLPAQGRMRGRNAGIPLADDCQGISE